MPNLDWIYEQINNRFMEIGTHMVKEITGLPKEALLEQLFLNAKTEEYEWILSLFDEIPIDKPPLSFVIPATVKTFNQPPPSINNNQERFLVCNIIAQRPKAILVEFGYPSKKLWIPQSVIKNITFEGVWIKTWWYQKQGDLP